MEPLTRRTGVLCSQNARQIKTSWKPLKEKKIATNNNMNNNPEDCCY
jgi:hypothetical protein